MNNRVKVGDVEIGVMKNPDPSKTNWIVYRYRPRTNEYLSKNEAYTETQAENLFTITVGQEELRQKRAAAVAATTIDLPVDDGIYRDHPYFARF
ncbi:hypothetical protein B9J07_27860 [Sinorhizobium sp. LM21]|uniref:hypothetical protein n=1 Tax=Sinorhizobium sp. LM21 TaxID=1449788 RepID=UPI0005D92004|nr:hypothetical protein [Sinorhizobium sp. LM21]AJW30191.1 hypothetical protein pLM21S1_p71 [Sinorhizobium sp. LM21]OWZ90405.1 hypothetical protein B9J07_27860 [Sinorhizobium sp. LM21]